MLDGLGMAEITPGPLILRHSQLCRLHGRLSRSTGMLLPRGWPAPWPAAAHAVGDLRRPASSGSSWARPYVERLRASRGLNAALSAITAAVVGVISQPRRLVRARTIFGEVRM